MRYLLSFLFVLPSFAFSSIILESKLSSENIRIGDHIELSIQVMNLETETVSFKSLTIDDSFASVIKEEIKLESIIYTIVMWETGEFEIPAIPIDILERGRTKMTLLTDPLTIIVNSNISAEGDGLKDIKGMHDINISNPYLKFIYLVCVLLSAAALYFLYRRREVHIQKAEKWVKPKDPPFIHAKKSLEILNCPYPINRKVSEEYYVEISRIFREYFENEFFVKALEMTTVEIRDYLHEMILDDKIVEETITMLQKFDMSKFAGHTPENTEFDNDKEHTLKLITIYHNVSLNELNYNNK
ncbi:MAG: hypothetical protein HN729_00880 [Candidatus Marinimicrobia bacterium]|nr:hypothetical protein [Candidatus Neomarinimicrobiota bacterium]MBT3633372.1 hypothetical protein [Candidatus Neomarinimicrobiota bacterium]MBT3681515.1 hypothetical protein [Candidatus Neomarinimicrobiota bacterium]MBT3758518.1 hypothetical protein [Candidatus Neomarinimicrobiota bacterium]MBT3894828.1 hypothetical protein [Candidatus Neomarinimicrobiota bacterium]